MRLSLLKTILVLAVATTLSCAKKDSDGSEGVTDNNANIADGAQAMMGSLATDTESGDVGTASVEPFAACTLTGARSVCSGAVMTVNWNGCTLGGATLTGGWTNTYDSSGTCSSATGGALSNGQSVTRTSSSMVVTGAAGGTLTTSTTAHTAYNGTSIPGTGIVVSRGALNRTVTINGVRRILKGPRGTTWFDHSITGSGITISGTKAGGNRVASGTINVYHNLAAYTASNAFNSVTWGTNSCCYPTSGNITTTYTGSVTGTTTLAFSNACGVASFTALNGSSATYTLAQCQ